MALSFFLLTGCGGGASDTQGKRDMRSQARVKAQHHNVSDVYYSLPSPLEIAHVIQTTGVEYEPNLLHKVELGVRYSTNMSSALNLGVYGADLSYSIYFDQNQVALKYLDCIRDLATGLEVADSLTMSKLKLVEDNIQNKEMLKKIVSQTFFHSDALLKESSRRPAAMMIVMGMWVESLYISTSLSESDPDLNPALSSSIVEQGLVFDDLMGMLGTLDESPDVARLKSELEPLRSSYLAMNSALGGTFVLQKSSGKQYDRKLFGRICDDVKSLRTNITEMF